MTIFSDHERSLISVPLLLTAGVVDRDYRGNVGVVLFNFGKEPFESKCGSLCIEAFKLWTPKSFHLQIDKLF